MITAQLSAIAERQTAGRVTEQFLQKIFKISR